MNTDGKLFFFGQRNFVDHHGIVPGCLRGRWDLMHRGLGLDVMVWILEGDSAYDSAEVVLQIGCISVMVSIPLGFLTRYFKKAEA